MEVNPPRVGRSHGGEDVHEGRFDSTSLASITATSMGGAAVTNIRSLIQQVDGLDLGCVRVDPAGFPVAANLIHGDPGWPKKIPTEFYVRVANDTKTLITEHENYIDGWFGRNGG